MAARHSQAQAIGDAGVRGLIVVLAAMAGLGLTGCATATRMPVRAERYRIDVDLDPLSHALSGRAAIDVVQREESPIQADGPVAIELLLHPDLRIKSVRAGGGEVRSAFGVRPQRTVDLAAEDGDEEDGFRPARHTIYLDRAVPAATLFVEFEGTLHQDVSAGEKPGEIHNFQMRAHVGEDGVYLAGGYWYPQPAGDEAAPTLADFTLTVGALDGVKLAASGERDEQLSKQTGRLAWRSPYRLDGVVLVGGKHQVHQRQHGDLTVSLHLKPEQAQYADGLFAAVLKYMQRYEPLIGEYPAGEYTIVDNFFSSGFAFPTFTLLSSAVIDMGERAANTHGYLDHEILHSWWGNGVHVDPRDGNWCEALASYGANYYGFVLDGDLDEARRKRRNFSHFLSRIKPEDDKPLGTFGMKDGCNRSIAYDKGAAVFHMLAWQMGQDAFWAAMRRLNAEYLGAFASWGDIERVCEAESGKHLGAFFEQWVRRGGAPDLSIEDAQFRSSDQTLLLTLAQSAPVFGLQVPVRVTFADRIEDVLVPLAEPRATVPVAFAELPLSVELDPDYHLFRKVAPRRIIPTTASTRFGTAFTVVLPPGEVSERYSKIQSVFESSFEPSDRIVGVAGRLEGKPLAERCALILGGASTDPYVSAFLSAIEFPVRWPGAGFEFDGVTYSDPGDAVLCTVAHPDVPGGGVTVVYANREAAIPSAFAIPMYDRSLVIFKNGQAVLKRDFERRELVPVTRL